MPIPLVGPTAHSQDLADIHVSIVHHLRPYGGYRTATLDDWLDPPGPTDLEFELMFLETLAHRCALEIEYRHGFRRAELLEQHATEHNRDPHTVYNLRHAGWVAYANRVFAALHSDRTGWWERDPFERPEPPAALTRQRFTHRTELPTATPRLTHRPLVRATV